MNDAQKNHRFRKMIRKQTREARREGRAPPAAAFQRRRSLSATETSISDSTGPSSTADVANEVVFHLRRASSDDSPAGSAEDHHRLAQVKTPTLELPERTLDAIQMPPPVSLPPTLARRLSTPPYCPIPAQMVVQPQPGQAQASPLLVVNDGQAASVVFVSAPPSPSTPNRHTGTATTTGPITISPTLRLPSASPSAPMSVSESATMGPSPPTVTGVRRRKLSSASTSPPRPAKLEARDEVEEQRRRMEAAESLVIISSSSSSPPQPSISMEDIGEANETLVRQVAACLSCPTASRYLTSWEEEDGPRSSVVLKPGHGPFRSFRKHMIHKWNKIKKAWQWAFKASPVSEGFFRDLVACHLGCGTMTRSALKGHLMGVARLFRDFALTQPEFNELCIHDQRQLLFGNAPVFLQFVIGRYLAAGTPEQQLDRLRGVALVNTDRDYRQLRLSMITIASLNKATGLLSGGPKVADHYQELCALLERMCAVLPADEDETLTPLLALVCLFRTTFITHLNEGAHVEDLASDVMLCVRWSNEVLGTVTEDQARELVECLEQMSSFFEEHVRWEEEDSDGDGFLTVLEDEISPSYTMEEDRWLHRQFFKFTETFQGVNYGEATVRACLNYNYDVPLEKSFGEQVILTMRERFFRILMDHEEFRERLNSREQMELYMRNVGNAVSLCIAKLETFETGYEQWRFSIGALDNALVQTTLKESLQARAIKKLTLSEVSGGSLDPAILTKFNNLVVNVSERVADVEDFKIMSMLILFHGGVSTGNPAPEHARQRYLRYYAARRHAMGEDVADGVHASTRLRMDISNVHCMSAILQMFMEVEAAKAAPRERSPEVEEAAKVGQQPV